MTWRNISVVVEKHSFPIKGGKKRFLMSKNYKVSVVTFCKKGKEFFNYLKGNNSEIVVSY